MTMKWTFKLGILCDVLIKTIALKFCKTTFFHFKKKKKSLTRRKICYADPLCIFSPFLNHTLSCSNECVINRCPREYSNRRPLLMLGYSKPYVSPRRDTSAGLTLFRQQCLFSCDLPCLSVWQQFESSISTEISFDNLHLLLIN